VTDLRSDEARRTDRQGDRREDRALANPQEALENELNVTANAHRARTHAHDLTEACSRRFATSQQVQLRADTTKIIARSCGIRYGDFTDLLAETSSTPGSKG